MVVFPQIKHMKDSINVFMSNIEKTNSEHHVFV